VTVAQRPLLMRGPLVRATLDGIKDVTRRLDLRWLKAKPGDLIWVKETFALEHNFNGGGPTEAVGKTSLIHFLADGDKPVWCGKTRVSIHLPKAFSRLWLEVVSVREEHVQDVTEEDAKRECARFHDGHGVGHSGWRHDWKPVWPTARDSFFGLWVEINGEPSLRSNPKVARIEFKRTKGNPCPIST